MNRYVLFSLLCLTASMTQAQTQPAAPRRPFVNYTEVGILAGRVAYAPGGSVSETVENKVSITAQTFNGVQLNSRLAVGGVVGIDWYTAALVLPIGAGVHFDVIRHPQKNVRLFGLANAGYGFTWLNKSSSGYVVSGGWMLNPGVGLRIGKPGGTAFVMSLSYKRQMVSVEKPITGNDIKRDEDRVYNRLALRLGVSF